MGEDAKEADGVTAKPEGNLECFLSHISALRKEAENEKLTMKTLGIVVKNVLEHGKEEEKFRNLRLSNERLMARLLKFPSARKLSTMLGFVHNAEADALVLPVDFEKKDFVLIREILNGKHDIAPPVPASVPSESVSGGKRDHAEAIDVNNFNKGFTANKKAKNSVVGGSSSGWSRPTPPPEVGLTVYCDKCNRARILTKAEEGGLDLSEDADFYCDMVERIKQLGGCEVTDDEIVRITGEGFGFVLNQMGILSRAELAACSPNQFDAGPYEPYIEKWIFEAQTFELDDIMKEVFDLDGGAPLDDLFEVGISSPKDIIDHLPTAFVRLFKERLGYDAGITEDVVKMWQEKAAKKADEIPWLEKYEYATLIEMQGDPKLQEQGSASEVAAQPLVKPKPLKIQLEAKDAPKQPQDTGSTEKK